MNRAQTALLTAALSLVFIAPTSAPTANAKSYELTAESCSDYIEAQVVHHPSPDIPEPLHENCFKSCCIARFMIDHEGKASVKLLSSSGSDEIDAITLQTLKKWKFKPAMLDGKPVASTRRIKVEFEVD